MGAGVGSRQNGILQWVAYDGAPGRTHFEAPLERLELLWFSLPRHLPKLKSTLLRVAALAPVSKNSGAPQNT